MNILLVDDDHFVIASLLKGIQWKELGFQTVHTAENITEAKKILTEEKVDMMISDIDMPNGSGLELLRWLRDQDNDMPVIMLTNYADFNYAQEALSLKSFHYFLKPILFDKLTEIIRSASQEFQKQSMVSVRTGERFWRAYISGELEKSEAALSRYFEETGLRYKYSDTFLPVLIDFYPYALDEETLTLNYCFSSYDQQTQYLKTTFLAAFSELVSPSCIFIEFEKVSARYLIFFPVTNPEEALQIEMCSENYVATVTSQTNHDIHCFVGIPSVLSDFAKNFQTLVSYMDHTVNKKSGVFPVRSQIPSPDASGKEFDFNLLEVYFSEQRYAEFEELCIRHLKTIALSGYAEPEALKAYVNNLFQTLLSFLQNRNILFDYIFRGAPFTILHENSPKSIYDATLFIRYVIRISSRYIEEMGSGQSVADTICRFIEQNYAKEISRNSLTEMFHFDPDYASRIFKKETGRSFKQYLIDKRIEEAKKLLLNSDLPISTVSDRVGYENYSYFTRLFKKETGMTPVDFRSQGKVH